MGPYQGGQAQYLRVPYADFNGLKLPPGTEHEADFALLADIFPTGWHGLEISGFKAGESVAVFGAGPVGLMAAYSAVIRGGSNIFVVDQVPERLDQAKKIGCIPINFKDGDPVKQIIEKNGGMVDRSVDAVGYQAVGGGDGKEQPNIILDQMIMVTRACGGLGIPGYEQRGIDVCGQLLTCFFVGCTCHRTQELPTRNLPRGRFCSRLASSSRKVFRLRLASVT